VVTLLDKDTGETIASIPDADLDFLIEQLEETSGDDSDYWIDGDTIDLLEDAGAPPSLVAALRRGLGGRDGMEIRWLRR
jgi:hypothetical protein